MSRPARTPELRRRRLWIGLGLLLMLAVFAVALLPPTRQFTAAIRGLLPEGDKLLHALAFLAVMGWWGNVFRSRRGRMVAALACLLFGAGIELAQWPHSPRDADPMDLLADAFGVGLALLLLRTPLARLLPALEARLPEPMAAR